jgi:hypothetical protein
MVKIFLSVVFFTLLFGFSPQKASAQVAGSSATIGARIGTDSARIFIDKKNLAIKKIAIKKVLERYNSPMVNEVDSFISACDTYELDCYLLPSIAGLESSFGRFLMPNSYNPFGWGGGHIYFKSWDDGIDTVAKGLRNNYMNKGATSLESIGRIYSESPTWAPRVRTFMSQMEKEEEKNQLFFSVDRVQL